MTSLFDKLNLNAQERRLVVITGIVVFALLNWFFVFPEFGEYSKYEQRTKDTAVKLKSYQDEISKRPIYQKQVDELKTHNGGYVPTEEAALRLAQEVDTRAALSGVTLSTLTTLQRQASGGKTNAFFEEAAATVNVNTGEKELIDFLYTLADKDLLIRAKSMNIGPDPTRMRLQGQITLVKSYQRRPPARAASTGAATARPASTASPPAAVTAKPAPAPPRNEPTVMPAPKPATPPPTVTPSAPPTPGGTNRPRKMPVPVKP